MFWPSNAVHLSWWGMFFRRFENPLFVSRDRISWRQDCTHLFFILAFASSPGYAIIPDDGGRGFHFGVARLMSKLASSDDARPKKPVPYENLCMLSQRIRGYRKSKARSSYMLTLDVNHTFLQYGSLIER